MKMGMQVSAKVEMTGIHGYLFISERLVEKLGILGHPASSPLNIKAMGLIERGIILRIGAWQHIA